MTMNIKHGRVLARSLAVVVVASLPLCVLVSSASARTVRSGNVSISAVQLNGRARTHIRVAPSSTISITLNYAVAPVSGSTAIEEIMEGYANQNPDQCIPNGMTFSQGTGGSGTTTFTETAPSTRGSYYLAFAPDLDFSCFATYTTWAQAGSPHPKHYAHVTVT
jgi:hypothetical protein